MPLERPIDSVAQERPPRGGNLGSEIPSEAPERIISRLQLIASQSA
jgi:hypothetical protein